MDDVRIYNRALGSNEVQALFWDGAAAAAAPTNLTASAGNGQVVLSWAEVPGITGYDLERATQSGGPYVSIAQLFNTSYTDTLVINGTTYYYIVTAQNSLGDGTNSVAASATPTLNASLKTWFAADAITGLANGAAISTWADLSGNGDDASQANSSQQPSYVANVINGLPVVRFNAASSNYLAFARPVQDDFTIFCVFRSTRGYGSGSLYFQGAGLVNGEVSGVTTDFGTCLFTNGQLCAGTGNPDVAVNSAPGFNDGRPHLLTFKRIESSGEIDLYVDGTFIGSTTGGTSALTAPNQLVLGAQQTLINFLNGDIAEVKIYNSALSDPDRNAVAGGLECKYGIPNATPPLPTPSGLAGVPGNRAIALSWSAGSGAVTYTLFSSPNFTGPFTVLATNLAASSYFDAQAVSGQTNYYEVMAVSGCDTSTASAPIGIYLPRPVLNAGNAGAGMLSLNWPAWATDWGLYFATNLNPPVVWYPATNDIGSNGGQFFVTIPAGFGTRFFRLAAP